MTTIDQKSLNRRQRWFPWAVLLSAFIMATGYVLLDLQLVAWPLAVGIPLALLAALALSTLRASVAPRRGGTYLAVAVFAVLVLRTLLGAVTALLPETAPVAVVAVVLAVSPLLVLAIVYFRRLR